MPKTRKVKIRPTAVKSLSRNQKVDTKRMIISRLFAPPFVRQIQFLQRYLK